MLIISINYNPYYKGIEMIVLKDNNGRAFGKLVTSPSGKIFAQTMSGHSKGYYDPNFNRTFTMEGKVVSTGNSLAAFLV